MSLNYVFAVFLREEAKNMIVGNEKTSLIFRAISTRTATICTIMRARSLEKRLVNK